MTSPSTPSPKGPLAGVKVVELSHIMAGPACGMLLADLGADVIKVEKVPDGDDSRRMLPPEVNGQSAAFMILNRNKRGMAINLKNEGGRKVLRRMLAEADIVLENYRVGTMEKLDLGYDSLSASNPALIYAQLTGFGATGPYADRAGFDLIAQGMSGLMSLTGEGEGRPPVKVGVPITDMTAGILGVVAILAAYSHRLKTGVGQKVESSLFEAGILHTAWQSAIYFATGDAPGALGSAHPLAAPYQAFQTSDGWINLGAANQANWLRLIDLLGADDLRNDARFAENAGRMNHLPELTEILSRYFEKQSTAEWLAQLDAIGVPAGPVMDVAQMSEDPQVRAREMVVELDHPTAGKTRALGTPVKFSRTPTAIVRPAPLLGQHTREILLEYGYDEAEIDALAAAGDILLA